MDNGDSQGAIGEFERILVAEPGYHDVAQQIAEARQRQVAARQRQASTRLEAARRLEAAGVDLVGARREYEAAQALDPTNASIREALEKLAARMVEEGQQAFRSARQFESRGRNAEAIPLYEKAAAYLPTDDPSGREAQTKATTLPRNR